MGIYSFIFGCMGLGIFLWVFESVFQGYLLDDTTELISNVGTLLFIIGVGSLAGTFLIGFFKS